MVLLPFNKKFHIPLSAALITTFLLIIYLVTMSSTTNTSTAKPKVTDFSVNENDKLVPLIIEQEQSTIFTSFSASKAWQVGNALRDAFIKRFPKYETERKGLIINIELFSGHRLFSAAIGESPAVGADNWSVLVVVDDTFD